MKTAKANTDITVYVNCPYCDSPQDRFEDLRDYFDHGEVRAENIEAELVCEDCQKTFIVDTIEF